jgi:hypothetical protein
MQLSSYQEKIIDWVKAGAGNACCNAVAGSGKSTTLRLAAIALQEAGIKPSQIKICVFGKANSLDLIAKFGNGWKSSISTLHSAGWTLVKRHLSIFDDNEVEVSQSKYKKIAEELGLIGKRGDYGSLQLDDAIEKNEDFIRLVNLVRLTNSEPIPETIEEICEHFEMADIYEFSIVADAITQCLKIGENQAMRKTGFDFTDQI